MTTSPPTVTPHDHLSTHVTSQVFTSPVVIRLVVTAPVVTFPMALPVVMFPTLLPPVPTCSL